MSKSSLAAVAALILVVSLGGCGRSDHEVITEYCRALAECGIQGTSAADVNACIDKNENPTGTAHEQCFTRELTVCLGNCYHAHGCTIFDENDPCSCQRKDYGCPD